MHEWASLQASTCTHHLAATAFQYTHYITCITVSRSVWAPSTLCLWSLETGFVQAPLRQLPCFLHMMLHIGDCTGFTDLLSSWRDGPAIQREIPKMKLIKSKEIWDRLLWMSAVHTASLDRKVCGLRTQQQSVLDLVYYKLFWWVMTGF
jgi:hypothetical protein